MPATILIAVGCAFVVTRIRRRCKSRDLHKIPLAPGTLPVIGNVGVVKAFAKSKLHEKYQEFAEAAGEGGVLRLCVAGNTRVLLTTPEAFAAVLRNAPFLPKPPGFYDVFYMFGVNGTSILNQPSEQEHARIRGHFMRFFNADNVSKTIWLLSDLVQASVAAIAAAQRSSGAAATASAGAASTHTPAPEDARGLCQEDVNEDGVLVDMFQMSSSHVLRVVFQMFIGVDVLPPMAVFNDILEQANSVAAHPLQYKLLKLGLYPGRRRFRRNWDALYQFHRELLQAIYSKPLPENGTSFWEAVRYAFPNAMTDKREFDDAMGNMSLIYAAGYETTANAITHTMAALALDQDAQAAIAEELGSEGLLATPDNPAPREILAEDLSKLKVLDAVIHESLRMMATAPNGGLRLLKQDTKVCGYVVPKGTVIMLPVWSLHYNKYAWGPDALQWRPDRWLEGKSVASARKDASGNLRFLTFLDGPSNCIGQHLALVEMKMAVASLVSKVHITMDSQRMGHLSTVEDYIGEAVTKITLQRSSPAWLRMKPRVLQQ